ncbi:uncharacterized protein DUF3152 [Knoellia remsis]|uniref:Uncharacterized protein DUF3152 n=1 Tax=Knoellia remsis TaxID=407159 RepID=A0A2T0UZH8_9MICO|nr:DUF3152 domain-containing protein [Knoellia remsis]PRY63322.1 uncharacterized protein DUF3152 [Knoellia remsis]
MAGVFAVLSGLSLWSFWPGDELSGSGRSTADLTSQRASLPRPDVQPAAAAEEVPTPTTSATPAATPRQGQVPEAASGDLTALALPAIAAPTVNPTKTLRVGFEVEEGAGVDSAEAARIISATLGDARGWQTEERVRFRAATAEQTAAGDVDLTVVLASPKTTDKLCAPLDTNGKVSCFNLRKAVLNARRWTEAVPHFGTDLTGYRQYLVNHEVGHGLYHGHVECPSKGAPAPIMLQQTKGLDGCKANAWPTVT